MSPARTSCCATRSGAGWAALLWLSVQDCRREWLDDRVRGSGRAGGVVGLVQRRPPERHHAVTDILVDRTVLGLDIPVQERKQNQKLGGVGGVLTLGQRGEADDVREQHGHRPGLGGGGDGTFED